MSYKNFLRWQRTQQNSVQLLSRTITLTDAQIKTLPVDDVTLITGELGTVLLFVRGTAKLDRTAGAYNGTSGLFLRHPVTGFEITNLIASGDLSGNAVNNLTPAVHEQDSEWLPLEVPVVDDDEVPTIAAKMMDGPALTGGHPNNTLKFTILYAVVKV